MIMLIFWYLSLLIFSDNSVTKALGMKIPLFKLLGTLSYVSYKPRILWLGIAFGI